MPKIVSKIVEVCVFSIVNKKPKFLLLKRSNHLKLFPDSWQIVSGKIEKKEKAFETALRELKEETGFFPKKFWTCPIVNLFLFPIDDEIHATSVFAVLIDKTEKPKLSFEHSKFKWLSLAEAKKIITWPGQVKALEITNDYIINGKNSEKFSEIPKSLYKI